MSLDFNSPIQPPINSAAAFDDFYRQQENVQRLMAQASREKSEKEKRMLAGAEANVAQKQLLEQQLDIIQKQNELLYDNFLKLKEMYDDQVQANKEAKDELERSRKYNRRMMAIAIVAMLAAIASPIVTLWVSR